jgi:hypothetical protein
MVCLYNFEIKNIEDPPLRSTMYITIERSMILYIGLKAWLSKILRYV